LDEELPVRPAAYITHDKEMALVQGLSDIKHRNTRRDRGGKTDGSITDKLGGCAWIASQVQQIVRIGSGRAPDR